MGLGKWEAIGRARPEAYSMKLIEIENRGAIVRFVRYSVVLPANSQVRVKLGVTFHSSGSRACKTSAGTCDSTTAR